MSHLCIYLEQIWSFASVTCSYTLKGVGNFPKFTNKKGEKHINNFTQASKLIDVVLKTIKSSSIWASLHKFCWREKKQRIVPFGWINFLGSRRVGFSFLCRARLTSQQHIVVSLSGSDDSGSIASRKAIIVWAWSQLWTTSHHDSIMCFWPSLWFCRIDTFSEQILVFVLFVFVFCLKNA